MRTMSTGAGAQLRTIGWLHTVLSEEGIDYWLFGGWAVDFHAGRVTRDHADIDVAVWAADGHRIGTLLEAEGWTHAPEPEEDGYTGYERGALRLELAFLSASEEGHVYTPLREGRAAWPEEAFEDDVAELAGVRARVMSLRALKADKAERRDDPIVAAKDRADLATLSTLS